MRRSFARSLAVCVSCALCALGAGCDEEVEIPPMRDPPVVAAPAARPVAAAPRRTDAGPAYLTGCVPESSVPVAMAASPPFEACYRVLRPGTGVHPRAMPPNGSARFDIVETVARRRAGEVVECCYTWPVRPPGSPVFARPSSTTAPPAGVGTAHPVVVRAPAPRPQSERQRPLPFGMHARPVVPALLGPSKLGQTSGRPTPAPPPPRTGAAPPATRRLPPALVVPTRGAAGSAPSTRGTPGTRSPR